MFCSCCSAWLSPRLCCLPRAAGGGELLLLPGFSCACWTSITLAQGTTDVASRGVGEQWDGVGPWQPLVVGLKELRS